MLDDVIKLREQAARARRLVAATTDTMARTELFRFAEECDSRANAREAACEAGDAQKSQP